MRTRSGCRPAAASGAAAAASTTKGTSKTKSNSSSGSSVSSNYHVRRSSTSQYDEIEEKEIDQIPYLDAGVLIGVDLSHMKCVKTLNALKRSLNEDRDIFRLSLQGCDLRREASITSLIATIDRVKYLTLSNCGIDATNCALLATGIQNASLLLDLDLSGNAIIGINIHRDDVIGVPDFNGLQTLLFALASYTQIKSLNLSQNHLGGIRCFMSADAPALGTSLRATVTTTMQAIADCGEVCTKMIVDFLRTATSMERLDISANGFKDDEDGALAHALLEAVGRAGKSIDTGTSEDHREAASASSSSSNSSCNAGSDIDSADACGDTNSDGSNKRRRKLMNELQPTSSCRSLCGLRPTSSCAHIVTYSQFSSHLDTNDCIDASDREWTGGLAMQLLSVFLCAFLHIAPLYMTIQMYYIWSHYPFFSLI